MFKNYVKIALRSLLGHKLISGINIIGLSIGLACSSLGFIFIQHELSFDRFHEEADQIFWVSASIQNRINIASTPAPLSPALKETFPEVSESFRLESHEILVQAGNEFFREPGHFVDPNFFTFFSFELLEGNPNQVFSKPNGIVLSQEMSRKYFGRLSPIGEELTINYGGEDHLFEVTGVAEDAPAVSSLQYNFLLPIQFLYQSKPEELLSNWGNFPVTSFFRLKEKEKLSELEEKLPEFINDKINSENLGFGELSFNIRSLEDYHLKDGFEASGLMKPADMSYVRILGIVAFLILLVACFNFMNLSNAKGSKRLSEVGIRRVLGALRKQLMAQFLVEAVIISLFSLGIGMILIEFSLPLISEITGFPISIDWMEASILLPLLGIAIITGLFAGFYPSLMLSRLDVVKTFKSRFKTGGNNWITKGSLIFQFALSIGLLSCTFIMQKQQQFIKKRNLGFDQNEIIVIPTQAKSENATYSQLLVDRYKEKILDHPKILSASGVSNSFNKGNAVLFIEEENAQANVFFYNIDADYIPLLDIELVEGKNFSAENEAVQKKSIIVNETFLKHFGINQIENYPLPESFEGMVGHQIIGVVKDYNFLRLKSKMEPLMLLMNEEYKFGDILVKVDPENIDQTLAFLRASWKDVNVGKPFEFSFLDEDIQQQYLIEERWNKAITGAAFLAILIACLGLFGLIALILVERTKEIGIRKILGATVSSLTWLISRQFVILMSIASIIAIPLAWWAMHKWLENFAYKIDMGAFIFILALAITLLIALLTAGLQTAKAAMQNPVDALRHE